MCVGIKVKGDEVYLPFNDAEVKIVSSYKLLQLTNKASKLKCAQDYSSL